MTIQTDYAPLETLSLSTIVVGLSTFSIPVTEWSSISGIRKGFRVISNDGGEALLIEDPQFQSLSIEVNIIKAFGTNSYVSGDWSIRVPRGREIGFYVPYDIKSTLLLPEYFESMQDVFIDEIQDAVQRFRNIRRWDKMDVEYLDLFLQTMGLFINSEQFDTETRRRLVKEFPTFIELAGTENFLNYLGFVVGAFFTSTQLWTKDYKSFIPEVDIPPAELDLFYPTNHVTISFDVDIFGAIDPQIIIDMFYSLASTPLVLDHIFQEVEAEPLVIQGAVLSQVKLFITSENIPYVP